MQDSQGTIGTFLKNNYWKLLTIFFGLVSLVSLILFVFFPGIHASKCDPKFLVEKTRSVIIRESDVQSAPIRVYKHDSVMVTSSVTAATFYLWNDGAESLDSADVLSQIQIIVGDSGTEILRVDTLKISNSITNLGLHRVKGKDSLRVLNVSFRILENKDGGAFQIIYEGDPHANIGISGRIRGKINMAATEIPYPDNRSVIRTSITTIAIVASFTLLFGASGVLLRRKGKLRHKTFKAVLIFSLVVMTGVYVYYLFELRFSEGPPVPSEILPKASDSPK